MKLVKILVKLLLALIVLSGLGFTAFWFSRPGDISFDKQKGSLPFSEYSKFTTVDGVNLHYQEKGAGTPVILVHGYAASTYTWKDVFAKLSDKYHVIAVDLKGFGFSGKPDGDYSRREQGRLVIALIKSLGIKNAWLIGNSMGGETVLNSALSDPQSVSGLVLIDAAGVRVRAKESLTPWYLAMPYLGPGITALALTSDSVVRSAIEKSYYNDSLVTDEAVSHYYEPLRTERGQNAARLAREQSQLYPIENRLGEIKCPTLIIWGAQDVVIPVEAGRRMNSLIKNSKLNVYQNVGHIPQEESPERVVRDIVNFIGTSEGAGKSSD